MLGFVDSFLQHRLPVALQADFDPEKYFDVPSLGAVGHFPALGDGGQRFDLNNNFVTRQVMADLAERALQPWTKGRAVTLGDHIGVDGPSGVGKTVAVYYLVCRLRQKGIFTLYIPNCDRLKDAGKQCVFEATILAVASIPGMMDTLCSETCAFCPEITWRDLLEKGDYDLLQSVLQSCNSVVIVLDRQNKAWADRASLRVPQMFYMCDPALMIDRQFIIAGSSNSAYFTTEWLQKSPQAFLCQFAALSRAEIKALLKEKFAVDDAACELVLDKVMRSTNGIPGIVTRALSESLAIGDVEEACSRQVHVMYGQVFARHTSYLQDVVGRYSQVQQQMYSNQLYNVYDQVTRSRDLPPTFVLPSDGACLLDKKLFLPSASTSSVRVDRWMFANAACERVFLEDCIVGYGESDQHQSDLAVLCGQRHRVGGELGHVFERFSISAIFRARASTLKVWQACNPSNERSVTINPLSQSIFDAIPNSIDTDRLYVPLRSTNPVFDVMISGEVQVTDAQIDAKLCVIQITMNSAQNLGHNPRDIYDAKEMLASRLESAFAGRPSSVTDDAGMRTSSLMYIYWTPLDKAVATKRLLGLPDWVWVLDAGATGQSILPREVVTFFTARAEASK